MNTVYTCGEHKALWYTNKEADLQQENVAVYYLGQHEQDPLQSSVHLQSGPQLQLAMREEGRGMGMMRGEKET